MSTVCMELEDAMTIFSYSSPYPVQLSLLPATSATSSLPRTPRGRRGWSLDQLEARRRRQHHGNVPPRLRPETRSHSDADVNRPSAENSGQAGSHVDKPLRATEEPRHTSDQLSSPSAQLRPAAVLDNLAIIPSTDDSLRDLANTAIEPADRKIATSTDQMPSVTQQQATVTASPTVEDNHDSLPTRDVAAEMLTASSPGVTSSSPNTSVTASLNDERAGSDDDVAKNAEERLEPCLETPLRHDTHLNNASDELISPVAPLYHHQQQQQQQQQKESGKAAQITPEEAIRPYDGGGHKVERNVDDGSSVPIVEPASTELATGQVFYDIDLNDDEELSGGTFQQRPASKKKRSLIGSLKALVKLRKSLPEAGGGAVAYVHPDRSASVVQQQSVVYVVKPQCADSSISVCHDGQHKSADTSSQLLASESGEVLSAPSDDVSTADSHAEAQAANVSDSRHQSDFDRLMVKEPQADAISGLHQDEHYPRQTDVENIELVTFENPQSTTFEELSSTDLPVTTVAGDLPRQPGVGRSKVPDDEGLVDTHGFVEHVTSPDRDQKQIDPDVRKMDVESRQQLAGLDRQHLDVNDNDLRCQPVVIQVTEPIVSTAMSDMSESVPTTTAVRPQVVEGKRSSERDLSNDELFHPVVTEISDPIVSKSTSDLSDQVLITQPQVAKDKRSSEDDLDKATEGTADIPSVLTMLLNLFSVGDEAKQAAKPTDDRTTSGHSVVAMETPTIVSGESRSEPVNDDVMRSVTYAARTIGENTQTDREHEDEVEDEAVVLVTDKSNGCFDEPAHNDRLSTNKNLLADQQLDVTSVDSRLTTRRTTADDTSEELSFAPRSDEGSNVAEPRTGLTSFNNEEAEDRSDAVNLSHREANIPGRCQYVDSSETNCIEPSMNKIPITHPPLVMGREHSNSSGIVDGERTLQTANKLHDRLTTRPNYDSAQDLVMGDVDKSENQTSKNETIQQPRVFGVPVTRGNQFPVNSREGASPTLEHLKRKFVVRPSADDFTFVVQQQVKVSHNYERSLSTGSSKCGNVCEKPAYTFVMPTVRRRSAADYSKNDLSVTRYSSTPHVDSDGRKSDITDVTWTTTTYTVADSSKYSSGKVVDTAVRHGRLPVRTGSENVFDRKQINSVGYSTRQLSESSGELRVNGRTVRRHSAADYSKSDLSITRYSSTPHVATCSDGRKSDIADITWTTTAYTVADSSKYNSGQVVDTAVRPGRVPVRTGSGNVFDRKQMNSIGYSTRQLSESSGELRVNGRTSPSVADSSPPTLTRADSPTVVKSLKDRSVSYSSSDHVTCSMPDLKMKSSSVDDVRPQIMTSYHICDVINDDEDDDDDKRKTHDLTRSLRDVTETGCDVMETDLCRSEPCLDVTASRRTRDVSNDDEGDASHNLMRLRLEPLEVKTGSTGSAEEKGEGQRVSRLTVHLGTASGRTGQQHVNNRRRPRRRRIVCLPHSSLTSATTNDVPVTSPTLTTH